MRLKNLAPNVNLLVDTTGRSVLFSYQIPVAVKRPDGHGYRTEKRYSVTTSKHITEWAPDAVLIDHEVFKQMVA